MKRLVVVCGFICLALSLTARPINGISVECSGESILVFLNGEQVCNPTQSCFIANLTEGRYKIEVYSVRFVRPNRVQRGDLLHSETIRYNGMGITDIFIKTDNRVFIDSSAMDDIAFNEFLRVLKSKLFNKDKADMIENAVFTTQFTSAQGRKMIETYGTEMEKLRSMKVLYPSIIDKPNFFSVIELLAFSSERDEMSEFIKNYHSGK